VPRADRGSEKLARGSKLKPAPLGASSYWVRTIETCRNNKAVKLLTGSNIIFYPPQTLESCLVALFATGSFALAISLSTVHVRCEHSISRFRRLTASLP